MSARDPSRPLWYTYQRTPVLILGGIPNSKIVLLSDSEFEDFFPIEVTGTGGGGEEAPARQVTSAPAFLCVWAAGPPLSCSQKPDGSPQHYYCCQLMSRFMNLC